MFLTISTTSFVLNSKLIICVFHMPELQKHLMKNQ